MKTLFFFSLPIYCSAWLVDKLHDHCGVDHVHPLDAAIDQARMRRLFRADGGRYLQKQSCNELCDGCIEIDTVFHLTLLNFQGTPVVPHPTSVMRRYDEGDASVTVQDFTTLDGMRQILRDNIDVANAALQGTPFRLRYADDNTIVNDNYMRYPIDFTREMSETIGTGDLRVLDVFLSYTVLRQTEATSPPLRVGTTFLPSQQLERKSDGMFLRYDTMTGAGLAGFDRGVTLIHEWGHWMGLCKYSHQGRKSPY